MSENNLQDNDKQVESLGESDVDRVVMPPTIFIFLSESAGIRLWTKDLEQARKFEIETGIKPIKMYSVEAIYNAVAIERERCAKIADRFITNVFKCKIADEIRSGA